MKRWRIVHGLVPGVVIPAILIIGFRIDVEVDS
jgi:hypothetical protein